MDKVDCVIIGGGVVGLAIANEIIRKNFSCVILEAESSYGQGISSRNSEVIHAGLYYPKDSLKAKFCVKGKSLLYEFCKSKNIPHSNCGKIIVTTSHEDEEKLDNLYLRGLDNGVDDLKRLTKNQIKEIEPNVYGTSGILSPSSGIIDSHQLMTALLVSFESKGGIFVAKSKVSNISRENNQYKISVNQGEVYYVVTSELVINSCGLSAQDIAKKIEEFPKDKIPNLYMCKGTYFKLTGKSPFSRLVYPMPTKYGLGIHASVDMNGDVKFGPDTEYIEEEDYSVDDQKIDLFFNAIKRYFPKLDKSKIRADYCGIRPKIQGPNDDFKDFSIIDYSDDDFPGLIQLFGIESPGLTSSMAIAEYINKELHR